MKKLLITILTALACTGVQAQLNLQMHYDMGNAIYGDELSERPKLTATVENFKADKWGSTYFFVDANFADNKMHSAYAEISRELKFWDAPLAVHVEYNGGLAGSGSYTMPISSERLTTGQARTSARHSLCRRSTSISPTSRWARSTVGSSLPYGG